MKFISLFNSQSPLCSGIDLPDRDFFIIIILFILFYFILFMFFLHANLIQKYIGKKCNKKQEDILFYYIAILYRLLS